MLNERDEHIVNQLHIIQLLVLRSEKHRLSNLVMSRKYLRQALYTTDKLMDFIEPGRTRWIR